MAPRYRPSVHPSRSYHHAAPSGIRNGAVLTGLEGILSKRIDTPIDPGHSSAGARSSVRATRGRDLYRRIYAECPLFVLSFRAHYGQGFAGPCDPLDALPRRSAAPHRVGSTPRPCAPANRTHDPQAHRPGPARLRAAPARADVPGHREVARRDPCHGAAAGSAARTDAARGREIGGWVAACACNLPFAAVGLPPAAQQQVELVIASDERRQGGRMPDSHAKKATIPAFPAVTSRRASSDPVSRSPAPTDFHPERQHTVACGGMRKSRVDKAA
jgi:hypothetical protein